MVRRIKRAKIHTIALCKRGKNGLPVIYKSEGDRVSFEMNIIKNENILGDGLVTSVVYAPELRDSEDDIASADVIKSMVHGFFREGGQINIEHDGKAVARERAYPAESFVIQKGDPRFENVVDRAGKKVDVSGGWGMIIKLEDPELRKLYASGSWDGVSMEGLGEFEAAKSDIVADALSTRLKQEIEMDAKELAAILKAEREESQAALIKTLTESGVIKAKDTAPEIDPIAKSLFPNDQQKQNIAHAAIGLAKAEGKSGADLLKAAQDACAPKTTEADPKAAPVFKGDPSKAEDVEKHQKALAIFKATSDLDWSDPEAVAKYHASLKKSNSQKGEDGLSTNDRLAGIMKSDSDEVRELKRELFKAQGRSNQLDTEDEDDDDFEGSGLAKSDRVRATLGQRMAEFNNVSRGFAKTA